MEFLESEKIKLKSFKRKHKNRRKTIKRQLLSKIIIYSIFFIIIFTLLMLIISFIWQNKKQIINENIEKQNNTIMEKVYLEIKGNITHKIEKDLDEEYKDMQEYIYMVTNGTLYKPNEIYYKSENPKISIVITVYNGEGFLETTLLSIQNQDFKDIEIIMIDDGSRDNNVNLIKKLMIKDPRIKLLQNEENRGMLYTKTKGVLNSKGKYVMLLDEDDIYVQKDAFLTLYLEAEENNLDIIGFAQTWSNIHLKKNKNKLGEYIETPIIIQPNVKKRMYDYGPNGEVKQTGGFIRNYFLKLRFLLKVLNKLMIIF